MRQLIGFLLSLLVVSNLNKDAAASNTNIFLVGDTMLGRSVMEKSLKGEGPNYPFAKVADELKSADIVFANLETPVINGCPFVKGGFKFCADPKMLEGLKYAGINIVSLANNHTLNYGYAGLSETKKLLIDNGIKWVGDGNLEIVEKNGVKFGFMGFDFVDYKPKDSDFVFIKESKSKVDSLIVMLHWGVEYTATPSAAQKKLAERILLSGADVLVGAHPHWVQTDEVLLGKPVFYSLGNFVFDQNWSEATKKGMAIKLTYNGTSLTQYQKYPLYMSGLAQPDWLAE